MSDRIEEISKRFDGKMKRLAPDEKFDGNEDLYEYIDAVFYLVCENICAKDVFREKDKKIEELKKEIDSYKKIIEETKKLLEEIMKNELQAMWRH